MTMTLISTTNLTSSAASITFSAIPQTATDLVAIISGRGTDTTTSPTYLEFNGSTTGYSYINLQGTSTTVTSTNGTSGFIGLTVQSDFTIGTFSACTVTIPNYAGSTAKTWSADNVQENNAATAVKQIIAGGWTGTAAISSIRFHNGGTAQWASGTTISLYSVTKGSGGATVS